MTHPVKPNPASPAPASLIELLEGLEMKAEVSATFKHVAKENYAIDVLRLVKALRESRRRYLVEVGPDSCEHKDYDAALAQLLREQTRRAADSVIDASKSSPASD